MTTFRKWPSIENTYQEQHIDWWLLRHPELAKAEYVVTEKLHGSNVQIQVTSDGEVSYGTRNGFAAGSVLFGWPANASQVTQHLDIIVLRMRGEAISRGGKDITLYGEIVGPGVQKGVSYGDVKQVYFFGWRIGDELQPLASLNLHIPLAQRVPIVAVVNGLTDALGFDTEFPTILNSEDGAGDLCEGVVIQPIVPVRDGDSYFLLKKKNKAFKEKQKAKKVRVPDEVVDPLNAAFREYINEQRMDNVFSKEGPIRNKSQIGKYIGLILVDAIEDFTKDYPEAETLDKKQRKGVFNVGSTVAKMLIGRL